MHRRDLTENSVRQNFDFYKSDPDFADVDFVLCSFVPSVCEGFLPLNKTIIMNAAHRYNMGRCTNKTWLSLNENLFRLKAKSKLIVSAMSRYDEEYTAHFTGLREFRLYAYGGFYAKKVSYIVNKQEILVGPTTYLGKYGKEFLAQLNNVASGHQLKFVYIREFYPQYSLSQLANHRAIVIFPYAVMTYSLIDFYLSSLPIFVPSVKFLAKNVLDRRVGNTYYCPEMPDIAPHNLSIHKFSPNDDSAAPLEYWLAYADYYQWPHVTTFDTFEELIDKIKTLDLEAVSEKMKRFNRIKEANMLDNWCRILKHPTSGSTVPVSFDQALKYFQMNRIGE